MKGKSISIFCAEEISKKNPKQWYMDTEETKFLHYIKSIFPRYFHEKNILNAGQYRIEHIRMFEKCKIYCSELRNNNIQSELVSYKKKAFPDKTFDVIYAIECLENDNYYEESIQNLYDMLNDDGILILIIKNKGAYSLDIHKLNKLLHLKKQFSYWNCYKTNDDDLLFIGMKIYVLLELPLQPTTYDVYAKEKYNQIVISTKNKILEE